MKRVFLILAALAAWTAAAATPNRTATESYVTNKISAAIAAIPAPDFSPSNQALVATIEMTSPVPGDYSTVSNRAMNAVQQETDPTIYAWAKAATKPTYTLNEIAQAGENWLGVQGDAGRHIKVLAGTSGGNIVGGLRVTASTLNDNNMTTYTYGGVAVKRNGTNTDYLFDTSSQSGIVRRSEIAAKADSSSLIAATNEIYTAIANIPIPDLPVYSETNTTANIVYHYGCETVAIPANGTLTGSTTNWPQGAQSFIVLVPAGAYTVSSPLEYSGYGTWPTNTALCVAWRYGSKIYVTPIKLLEE